jgi:hypothetical protein
MKLAFFGYAWNPGGHLDGYMQEAVNAYLALGFDVDIYLGNYFTQTATIGFKDPGLLERLVRHVRAQDYVAAVSMNNSLIMAPIVDALGGRVISVIVDGFNHQFRHDPDRFAAFRLPVHFAPIGSQFEREILAGAPNARVTFLTPATEGMHFPRAETPLVYPISWIASLVTDENAETMVRKLMSDPRAYEVVRACLMAVAETGDLTEVMSVHDALISPVIEQVGFDFQTFEMVLQDMVTSRDRVEVVNRLAPHGLALFGNEAWAKAMVLGETAFQAFRPGPPVRTHQELLKVYNSSRLAVNLPQSFISESFQYRVLDVMSSNALLVTRRTPEPDIHRVFGPDCPVVMYDSLAELEAVCAHFLAHEDERAAKVAACNALVTEAFSFRSRVLDYLRLAGVDFAPPADPPPRGRASLLIDESFP